MKALTKYLFFAVISAFSFASCEKAPENEMLNPKGTPVQFTLSGDKAFTNGKADITVTANAPVPADVTVTLGLDPESTAKSTNVTFPTLVVKQGETSASGQIELNPTGLEYDTVFKVIVKGAVAGVDLAQKVQLSFKTDPAPPTPVVKLAIDGIFTEWDEIEEIAGEGAIYAMKSIVTDDKLYFYFELDNTALNATMAFGNKIHLCFDNADMVGDMGGSIWTEAQYDKDVDIWVIQNGVADMITWGLDGFEHKEALDGDMVKLEFCFNRSVDDVLKADFFRYGAFLDGQFCDTSSGKEVWGGSLDPVGCAPKFESDMLAWGKPHVGGITIDGNMSDWYGVQTGVSSGETGVIRVFKATYDEEYIYLYNKRTWHDGLWGAGYYYYEFDTDDNPDTNVGEKGVNGNNPAGGTDLWMYLYVYGGTATEPSFNANPEGDGFPSECIANILCNGTVNAGHTFIDTEVRIPRSNIGVQKGQTINIFSWGNKSGSNLKSEAVTLTFEN